MADGEVGKEVFLEAEWENFGSDAPTASTVRVWIVIGGARSYLQADLVNLGATPNDFATVSLGSGAFRRSLVPIVAMAGYLVEWEFSATGPLSSYLKQGSDEGMKVTVNDEDDIVAATNAARDTVLTEMNLDETNVRSDIAASKADMDSSFTAVNTKLDNLGLASESVLYTPAIMVVPLSGSKTYRIYFVLKDLDMTPTALVDPDSNQVDLIIRDQAGAVISGLTLSGAPAGRLTRESLGIYYVDVTVSSTVTLDLQGNLTASYMRNSVANVAKGMTVFMDTDPILARIDANVSQALTYIGIPGDSNTQPTLFGRVKDVRTEQDADEAAILAEIDTRESDATAASRMATVITEIDTRESETAAASRASSILTEIDTRESETAAASRASTILAEVDTMESEISAASRASADLASQAAIKAVVDAIRATDVPDIQANIVAVLGLLQDPDFGLAALKGMLGVIQTRLGTNIDLAGTTTVFGRLRQIVDTYLADANYGLAALNTDLDVLLARLGITTDTGGSTTAGSAMAKLNAILAFTAANPVNPDIDAGGTFPPQS